ncbi:hypothetical protein [Streptomyces sp. NPDC004376]
MADGIEGGVPGEQRVLNMHFCMPPQQSAVDLMSSGRPEDRLAGRTPQERQWFLVSMEFTLHAARDPALARELAVREERLTQGLADVLTTALAHTG